MDTVLNTSEIYKSFDEKLLNVNRKELLFTFAKRVFFLLIYFLVVAFVLILSESVLRFPAKARTIIYWGYSLSFFASIIYTLLNYILGLAGIVGSYNVIKYAGKVGSKFSDIKDKIANALSLYKSDNTKYYSQELSDANLTVINSLYGKKDLASFIPFAKLKSYALKLGIIIAFIAICFAIFPGTMFSSLNRYINHSFEFIDNEYGIAFEITPGNTKIVKGNKLDITIKVISNKADLNIAEIEFVKSPVLNNGDKFQPDSKKLSATGDNLFKTTIENINTEIVYNAVYKGIKSEEFIIRLEDYPVLQKFTITVIPPAYTNSQRETYKENVGNIICPEGSKIEFNMTASKELTSAGILLNNLPFSFKPDGVNANGSITAEESGKYYFFMKDNSGAENRSEQAFELCVIQDQPPRANILEPKDADYTLKGEKSLPLLIRISDDYGFSDLKIQYRVLFETANYASANLTNTGKVISAGTLTVPLVNRNTTGLEVSYIWDLKNLKLSKGIIVEYWAEVTDVAGKVGKSEVKVLRYKSLAEIFKENQKIAKNIEEDLKSLYNDINNLQKDLADLNKDLKNSEELGVNDPAKKQQLQQKVDNIQSNIKATQEKIENAIQNLQQNNQLSSETLEQYMKLQDMFNKLATPEFLEKLKKIQDALKKNNLAEMKKDMQNVNFDEEAYKKQLEQMMNLLKQIEELQKLGELATKAEEIYREQENLKLETMNSDKNNKQQMNELSDKQKQIQQDYNKFKQDAKDLSKDIKNDKTDIKTDKLNNTLQKNEQKNTSQKMQKSSEQLNSQDPKSSKETQDDILKDLSELSEDMMDSMEESMNMEGAMEKMMQSLQNMKKDIEQLSSDQSKLKGETSKVNPNMKGDVQDLQKEQGGLKKRLSDLLNQFYQLSMMGMEIPPELSKDLGDALKSMNKAEDELGKSNMPSAESEQGKAKQALDNASSKLGSMLDQMGKDGKSGKKPGMGKMGMLMSKLAQLIKMQQGLNSEMNKMGQNGKFGDKGKDGKDNPDQTKDQMEKLKLQQEQIKKSMEELNAEIEKEFKNTDDKPLGDLNSVIKEMEKTIHDFEANNVDKNTIERQNKIVSRMLEFQLSQREKDFEQKRESKPGDNFIRTSPGEIIISGPASFNAIKEDFLKKEKSEFSEEYLKLIDAYLKTLK